MPMFQYCRAAFFVAVASLTLLVSNTRAAQDQEVTPLQSQPVLSLAIAQLMARACQEKQRQQKKPAVSIAIYDQGANLLLFHRMQAASLGSAEVAMEKGKSSAHFPVPTRLWHKASYGQQGSPGINLLPNITAIAGGLPIKTSTGKHLGGIGVSGSSADDDEACAQAGLNAARPYLVQDSARLHR